MLPYASTIFLSAFLLFLVQPLIAKQILPWFGGSAAVWTTCLLFFQSILLAGYAYADASVRWLKPRGQVIVHVILLALSVAGLPILADAAWKPAGTEDPIFRILGLLAATIGLQYFLLSTTTPLIQAWYWRRFQTGVPYRLFALSNFASLLALLGYPTIVEPLLGGTAAATLWSWLYALWVLVCAATAYFSLRHASGAAREQTVEDTVAAPPLAPLQIARWLVLSALGSCVLLAISNHLTQNISSVPFMWVLPLSLYLITFIICFDHPRWYHRGTFLVLLAIAVPAMAYYADSLELAIAAPVYCAGLFVACMVCHGELVRFKPHPKHLTVFYLMISLGGAIGALLVAIGAPTLLRGYFEMHIVLAALAILLVLAVIRMAPYLPLAALGVALLTGYLIKLGVDDYTDDIRVMDRDFYGVTRTVDRVAIFPFRVMLHGGINHGGQLLDPKYERTPTSYFGPTSGYGRLFASLPDAPRSVGVLGLGAGALAVYSRPGDGKWVFYEIDPIVARVAKEEFTYLSGMPVPYEIVLGDGRLALEREAPRKFDVLAIDAFSGDSIPMHLITREAMQAYVKHVKPEGAIVFQATNRFVDILPVVKRHADEMGLVAVHVSDVPRYRSGPEYWLSSTDQIIVTRKENAALFEHPRIKEVGQPLKDRPELPVFTDDYYNLLRILK